MIQRLFCKFLPFFFLFIWLSTAPVLTAMADEAQSTESAAKGPYVQMALISESKVIKPGGSLWLAIKQDIAPHWHTYWQNPGDSGAPLNVKWTLPAGFSVDQLLWPVPERIPYEPLVNFGYENSAVILARLHAADDIAIQDSYKIEATIEVLVCQEICIPEFGTYETIIMGSNTEIRPNPKTTQLFMDALDAMPSGKWGGSFTEIGNHLQISFEGKEDSFEYQVFSEEAEDIYFFPEEWGIIKYSAPQNFTYLDGTAGLQIERDRRSIAAIETLSGILTFKDGVARRYAIRINADNKSYSTAAATAATPAETAAPQTAASDSIEESAPLSMNILLALGFALLGGMILNLMPCVFPVLSMKALSLCKMADKEHKAARLNGLAYTAGILISFAVFAIALIAIKAGGAEIGWGFQLQNPAFVLVLAYILFAVGLNLSGFFEVSAGRFANFGQALTLKDGASGSFFTGILATLVATPCTAPFMGAAMGYALTQPAAISLLIFITLGFGLALPYLALSFVPALRSFMPRPGSWMDIFKGLMAFPMYISAAWLIWVYSNQTSSISLLGALIGITGLVFGIWILRHHPKKIISTIAFIIMLGSFTLPLMATMSLEKSTSIGNLNSGYSNPVVPFSQEALEQALRGDKPVFINMTADWCITCKVNEKVALKTDKVQNLFLHHDIIYLKGDWTNRNPEITQYLNKYQRQGVPIYVFYPARDKKTGKRAAEIILPQILTPQIVANTINQASL